MTTQSFGNPFRPFNPFLPSDEVAELEVDEDTEGGDVSYALVQSGPAVSSEEAESHLDAVEVKVSWGVQVLSTSHLEAGKGFSIGDGGDFVHPNAFGKTDLVGHRSGTAFVAIPAGATAKVFEKNESPRSVNAGDEIDLKDGMRVVIELDPVTIEVATVRAGRKFKIGFLTSLATGAAAAIGLSFVGHAAVVASMAMFMPHMGADDAESIGRDQILKMQALLDTAADREQDRKEEEASQEAQQGGGSQGGERHSGPEGAAGTNNPVKPAGHMQFAGNDSKTQLSREQQLAEARTGGLIGIINSGALATGPTSPWGNDAQLGTELTNTSGSLFGDQAGDAFGYGFGLTGIGEGGGGKGAGVGIDGVGDLVGGGGKGPGKWGIGHGDKDGIGNGHSPLKGGHIAKAPPPPREGTITTNGHIPPEVIQRIVRQNFGRFRLCYEAGLRGNPTLSGRVVTKFVIGRDGAVSQAADGGSDLPSQDVVSCVVRSFQNLSFPTPEGGVATVIYPISLNPGE